TEPKPLTNVTSRSDARRWRPCPRPGTIVEDRGPSPHPVHLLPRPGASHYSTATIRYSTSPRGVVTATTSPTLRPMSARPTGDEFEMRPSAGFASVDPTIRETTTSPAPPLSPTV